MCKRFCCGHVQNMWSCAKKIVAMCKIICGHVQKSLFVAMCNKCGRVQKNVAMSKTNCGHVPTIFCGHVQTMWSCATNVAMCKRICGHVQKNLFVAMCKTSCGRAKKMWPCPNKIVVMHTCKHDCGNKLNHEIGLGREARRPKPYGTQPSTNANAS